MRQFRCYVFFHGKRMTSGPGSYRNTDKTFETLMGSGLFTGGGLEEYVEGIGWVVSE